MHPGIGPFGRILPVACLALALAACAGWPGGDADPEPAATADGWGASRPPADATRQAEVFSTERAWAHLVALSDLGPRPSGSVARQEAAEYIRSRLAEIEGVEVLDLVLPPEVAAPPDAPESGAGAEGQAEGEADGGSEGRSEGGSEEEQAAPAPPVEPVHHIVGRSPGESPDSILLLAHYDTRAGSPGANDGASGPAVMLELARQLAARPLHYTVELVFLDGDMRPAAKDPDAPSLAGSIYLARYLVRTDSLDRVRLAVVYRQVGDVDLTIPPDLFSHRLHRESFFEAAGDLGYGPAFTRDRGYVQSVASHRPFVEVGMPRVVALHDPWYGGDEAPGEYAGGEHDVRDHTAPQSLHTVGVVSLAALRDISARLEKVDRLSGRAERVREESAEPPRLTGEPVEAAPEPEAAPDDEPSGFEGAPEDPDGLPEGGEDVPGTFEDVPGAFEGVPGGFEGLEDLPEDPDDPAEDAPESS